MKKKIFDILNKVGVPCNLKGRLCVETASRVERAIRHAIEVCFYNTNPDTLFEVFGNTLNIQTGKLTNSEFIYGLKKYIDINFKEA